MICLLICKLKSLHIYWETHHLLCFDANDLLKIWPSIFLFKMRNVRPCKYSSPWLGLISKLTSQTGKRTITIQILSNISGSKYNQTSGLVIEYNLRNIFLQKSCQKWGREANSRPIYLFVFKTSFILSKGQQLRLGSTIKTTVLKLQTDLEICSILIF